MRSSKDVTGRIPNETNISWPEPHSSSGTSHPSPIWLIQMVTQSRLNLYVCIHLFSSLLPKVAALGKLTSSGQLQTEQILLQGETQVVPVLFTVQASPSRSYKDCYRWKRHSYTKLFPQTLLADIFAQSLRAANWKKAWKTKIRVHLWSQDDHRMDHIMIEHQ